MNTETKAENIDKSKPKQAQSPKKVAKSSKAIEIGPSYAIREDAMAWVVDAAQRRGLDATAAKAAMTEARFIPQVKRLMTPAATSFQKNWAAYRSRFVEPRRLAMGMEFWQANTQALAAAEQAYGVPAHIIVGILGIETMFGRDMGSFRVLDALATLAFDFPSSHKKAAERQAFFRSELEQFLSLCERSGRDPKAALGSYAGAMGYPQFMPSSWTKHAIDGDGDGQIDLFASPTDAINSVANYLKNFGWQANVATHYPADFSPDQASSDKTALLDPDIVPTFTSADLQAKGMNLSDSARAHGGKLALVELFNGNNAPSYVIGTQNFYVVTRYNWSSYYALAVIEFGQAVEARLGK